jgi:hypothetical protein
MRTLFSSFRTTTPTPTLGTPIALSAEDTSVFMSSIVVVLDDAVSRDRDEVRLIPLDEVLSSFCSIFFLFNSAGREEVGSDARFPPFSAGVRVPTSSRVYNARSTSAALNSSNQPELLEASSPAFSPLTNLFISLVKASHVLTSYFNFVLSPLKTCNMASSLMKGTSSDAA